MLKKYIALLLIFVVVASSMSSITCLASEQVASSYISMNDDFSDDRIIVAFDNKSSLNFYEYSITDFASIGCKRVTNLSKESGSLVKQAMENISLHVTEGKPLEEYNGIGFSEYNQILCLEIANPGKNNVVEAIKKIEQMEGVIVACPNYNITTYTTSNDPQSMDYRDDDGVDYLDLIGLYDAWDITTGSRNVTVGVIDSGIDDPLI